MLEYNAIVPKKCIVVDGQPYEVLTSHVFRMQARKPVNQTKLRNLVSGKVTERSFHQSESVEEADIESANVLYLYQNRNEYWFCEEKDRSKRFTLSETVFGDGAKYIKPNSLIEALMFNEKVISVKLPIKVDLKVIEAAPAVKGDTAQGANKSVVMETGLNINVPLFINEGDVLKINTETGEYAERVDKK